VEKLALSTELADGLARALWHGAVKGDGPPAPGKIHLDVSRLSVPLHPGAKPPSPNCARPTATPPPRRNGSYSRRTER